MPGSPSVSCVLLIWAACLRYLANPFDGSIIVLFGHLYNRLHYINIDLRLHLSSGCAVAAPWVQECGQDQSRWGEKHPWTRLRTLSRTLRSPSAEQVWRDRQVLWFEASVRHLHSIGWMGPRPRTPLRQPKFRVSTGPKSAIRRGWETDLVLQRNRSQDRFPVSWPCLLFYSSVPY